MAAPAGSILPDSYFQGLSELWGACAYVASAIVAAGFVYQAVRARPEPTAHLWLIAKVFFIGLATMFLREWLMRLNDVVSAFSDYMGIDPAEVDERFIKFITGTSPSSSDASVWDVIWNTGSIGTAICYAMLWMFGWLSWGVQYIVKLIGDILLSAGWSLSPIFLSFFMIRAMAGVALRYLLGLVALVCWPFGWVMAAVVTNSMLQAAANSSLIPVFTPGAISVLPALTVLLIGAWMLISSALAPYVATRVLLMGANPAGAFARGAGDVAHAAVAGGFGAGAAAVTGGAAAASVIASAVVGAASSATESAARGGGPARTTATTIGGLSGLYGATYRRKESAASQSIAAAYTRMARAAESMAEGSRDQREFFREANRRMSQRRPEWESQPHNDNPNEEALLIESNARKPPTGPTRRA